jgi:hypothetical protein
MATWDDAPQLEEILGARGYEVHEVHGASKEEADKLEAADREAQKVAMPLRTEDDE